MVDRRLLLLLHRFSRVRLCATPETAAHQASRPWDSPGKNTGVGCHFLLQCMKMKSENEVAQSCPTLVTQWTAAYQAPPSMGFSGQIRRLDRRLELDKPEVEMESQEELSF